MSIFASNCLSRDTPNTCLNSDLWLGMFRIYQRVCHTVNKKNKLFYTGGKRVYITGMIKRVITEKVSVSIDKSLLVWVDQKSRETHTNRSRYLNRLIVEAMMREGFKTGVIGVVNNENETDGS